MVITLIRIAVEILENILTGAIGGLFDWISQLVWKERKTVYNADFLPSSAVLSGKNRGFCLDGRTSLSLADSTKNVLVIGSTGANKSSGILIPSVLRMAGGSSLIVNDPSGELLQKTSGALLAEGYDILVLSYGSPQRSEGYNPVLRAKSASDLQKIAKMLVATSLGTGGKDPFWNLASESVITFFLRYVVGHTAKEYHTLYQVYHLLSSFAYEPEKIDRLIVATGDDALVSEYKAFISYGDKTLSSIIATCRTALSIFGTDPEVLLTTSRDTIDVRSFREKKTCLFINTSTQHMRYYSVITSLFLEQFFGDLMSSLPGNDDLPVYFLLDEASSIYFNSLQITVANIRKYSAGILQVYQSAAQLTDLYGQSVARAITENSYARVYMPGQPIQVAQELEATLGKFEFVNADGVRQVRPLMTANEIRESSDSIILCGNSRAVRTRVVPYFEQRKLLALTSLPPFVPQDKQRSHPRLLKLNGI